MSLATKTAHELIDLLRRGETTSVEVLQGVFEQIDRREGQIHAFITLRARTALLDEAERVDRRRQRGEPVGPLAGLPVAVKDCICTAECPTTCASRMLEHFVPPYDAFVVARIKAADGLILGKTNLDEFCMGSSTENSAFGPTRNPHDLGRVPGGTSGGSAAALAADITALALGSDTGGSVRQPAAFCGVVGMKPTYGRVSRRGLIAYGSSLDQIGPLGKNVRDAALLLSAVAGHDPDDSTSLDQPATDYLALLDDDEAPPPTVGVPEEYLPEGLHAEVRQAVERAAALLAEAGCTVRRVHLPHTRYALAAYYIIACAEASSNLARYDGCHYGYRAAAYDDLIDMMCRTRQQGFGDEVKRRIMLGTYTLSAGYYDKFYNKASKVRALIRDDFRRAFDECEVLLTPITPTPPYRLGEKVDDPLTMYLGDIYSVTANLAGLPAISLPGGWTADRLPVGVQLTAPWLEEGRLLRAAQRLEALLAAAGISRTPPPA